MVFHVVPRVFNEFSRVSHGSRPRPTPFHLLSASSERRVLDVAAHRKGHALAALRPGLQLFQALGSLQKHLVLHPLSARVVRPAAQLVLHHLCLLRHGVALAALAAQHVVRRAGRVLREAKEVL